MEEESRYCEGWTFLNLMPHYAYLILFLVDVCSIYIEPNSVLLFQLELQFEGRSMLFTVTPVLASIIMQFQDQTR